MADTKISPHSLAELKNTTDDALGNYLRGLKFEQDNTKLDVRLAIGYASVIIAAATFAADYKLGWEATKTWTAVAVVAYALLNGAFTYWMWAVEKGCVFAGVREGKKISVASKTKKHDPTYYLTISSANSETRQITAPFTTWFTADGYFVAKPFQQWLASSVEAIGNADSKNAQRGQRDDNASPIPEVELTPQGNGTIDASGTDSKSKGSKRSKRKG
ncbi:signal peptidase complex subunit spc2 [Friedmanniomyces endolithicus]|nr:signal peptidase complex subunit spc2 [Friedmanniomyces endolithicus]KAK0834026.1 signal peptidase complex subunit spc2 [Friedmanniomyces endolithicus]